MNTRIGLRWLFWALAWGFLIFGFAVPLFALVGESGMLSGQGGVFLERLWDPIVRAILTSTLSQAAWSLAWSAVLGLLLGIWIPPRRRTALTLALPVALPTIIAASAWVSVLGKQGFGFFFGAESWLYSRKAVILAHVFFNAPYIALRVMEAKAGIARAEREVARTLGATRNQVFAQVDWPAIRAPLGLAASQVWLWCVMSFSLVLLLGGGPPVDTLETAIFARIRYGSVDLPGALACAFWQLILTSVPGFFILRRQNLRVEGAVQEIRIHSRGRDRGGFSVALLFLVPYLALVFFLYGKTTEPGFIAEFASALLVSLRLATGVTLAVAVIAGVVLLGVRRGRGFFLMPGGISVLVLGLGLWLAYRRWIDFFAGEIWALIGFQALLFVPWFLRVGFSLQDTISRNECDAARTLGASPLRAFWVVESRRWRAPVLLTLAGIFSVSVGEVTAVSFFRNENLQTLPLQVMHWLTKYRMAEAEWAGAGLMFFSVAIFFLTGWALPHRKVRRC